MSEKVVPENKIALVSCSGLSPLGLVVRTAAIELALDNDNIVSACITNYSAQPEKCAPIVKDSKVISISGCDDDCVSKILEDKDIKIEKNISADKVVEEFDLEPNDSARLDQQGELAVKKLKEVILKELEEL